MDDELVMGGINHYNGTTYWVEQVLMHIDKVVAMGMRLPTRVGTGSLGSCVMAVCCGFRSHF